MSDLPTLSFADSQADYRHKIRNYGDELRRRVLSGVSIEQQKAWPTKGRIASNIISGTANADEVATVQAEADERGLGETAEALAAIQFAKSLELLTIDNVIEGMTHKALTAVSACETEAELAVVIASLQALAASKEAQLFGGGV
ncbi:MAG: hypothetical protein ACSHXY_09795 [Alphaproteobacteria bacterium]